MDIGIYETHTLYMYIPSTYLLMPKTFHCSLDIGLCLTHLAKGIMSFGFGIGDFIAVGELCWKLYSQVYKVSRDAPEELRGLNQELGNLHNTIQLLVEELKDEDSVLKRSGDIRINLVNRVMSQSEETLQKMLQLSKRYAELQTPIKGREKRLNPRIYWDRLKYSQELHTINDLRAKVRELFISFKKCHALNNHR